MEKFIEFLRNSGLVFKENSIVIAVITILAFFMIFLYTIDVLKKNNAKPLIVIFVVYILLTGFIFMGVETTPTEGLAYFFVPVIFLLAVIILFKTEIRRDIWGFGIKKQGDAKHHTAKKVASQNASGYIDEIVKSLQNMSKNDVGAIIILANDNMPKSVLDSGVTINAEITSALIESIFFPKTPLHDGAMVINGNMISTAGCFLPLSQEVNLPKELGTRHRAGIGITENINVTALIVSEETGIISIAQGGKIRRYADSEMLRRVLKEYYWQEFIDNKN